MDEQKAKYVNNLFKGEALRYYNQSIEQIATLYRDITILWFDTSTHPMFRAESKTNSWLSTWTPLKKRVLKQKLNSELQHKLLTFHRSAL